MDLVRFAHNWNTGMMESEDLGIEGLGD